MPRLGLILVMAIIFPGWTSAQLSSDGPPKITHHSNQLSEPFMFLGRLMDESHPQWKKYSPAIRKFPTVIDCLKNGDDVSSFRWDLVRNKRHFEVCAFRMAQSLDSVRDIRAWLESGNFVVGELSRTRRNHRDINRPTKEIAAYWTVEQYRASNPNLLTKLLGFDLVKSFSLQINFSEDERVVGTIAHAKTK